MPDFSLLQNASIPHPQAIGQQPVIIPQSGLNTLAAGIQSGMLDASKMQALKQQLAIQQQQANLNKQLAPSEIQLRQAQAQQAALQTQQLQNQINIQKQLSGVGTINPPNSINQSDNTPQMAGNFGSQMTQQLPSMQLKMGMPGSGDAYTQQIVNIYRRLGRPDLADAALTAQSNILASTVKSSAAIQDMTEKEAQNKYTHLQHAGSIAFALSNLPENLAVQKYDQTYGKLIRNIDPNAPTDSDTPETKLAYLHGAAAAYVKFDEAVKTNPAIAQKVIPDINVAKEFGKEATTKNTDTVVQNAQDLLTQRTQEYQDAINKFGANSPQAKAAKENLDTAHDNVIKTTTPGTIQSITSPIGHAIGNLLNTPTPSPPKGVTGKTWTFNPSTGKLE